MTYATFEIETPFWNSGKKLICGIDEVGRGSFAGPVVVGAVIFPPFIDLPFQVADSKLLKAPKREELTKLIQEFALFCEIAQVEVEAINKVGIGKATQIAFYNVVKKLAQMPDQILIDAFYIQALPKSNQTPIVNGDKLSASIAAASIIAKVYRDNLMIQLDEDYPNYGLAKHKGYGTKEHQMAIQKYGLSKIHRTSFNYSSFLDQNI